MKTTLVLPTYNEAENMPILIPAILELPLPELQILVVDDNSPDGTGDIVEGFVNQFSGRVKVLHREEKLGLGSAYIKGFRSALDSGAEAIAQMDSDFSHPFEKLPLMHEKLKSYDVVLGSRYVEGGSLDKNWPLWRKGLSGWGNFYARTILNMPIRDVTGGFRLWRRKTIESLPLENILSNGYVFQIELGYLVHKLGFRVCEVPIYFSDRKWGTSKMNLGIQLEAAVKVWQVLIAYRNLNPIKF